MNVGLTDLFGHADRVQIESLNQRLVRSNVINANIANAETPGFRAIGYSFEDQLQAVNEINQPENLHTTNPKHLMHPGATADARIEPDVFVQSTESIGHDGNTVEVDKEMADLARNQILFRAQVETLTRKIGLLTYAINGG